MSKLLQQRSARGREILGCEVPIVLAGMGGVARSDLVSAVTAAGGFGFLGMVREPTDLIVREVKAVRARGHRRFGVNLIPAATERHLLERQVLTCIELAVPVVALFWDIDTHLVARLRDAGIAVVYQVGSVEEAIAAERAGAEIIIAQGVEAGGHVRGTMRLRHLLPEVVSAVQTPVLAAGGLANGRDLVTCMALGAEGIVLGTAMLATAESFAHEFHKQRVAEAKAEETVLTDVFHINWPPGAAVRVLRNEVTRTAPELHCSAKKIVIGEEDGRPIYLFSTDSPLRSMTGDFDRMALYAGTGVDAINQIVGAGARVRTLFAQAERLFEPAQDTDELLELSSSVCYLGEFSGSYVGQVSDQELAPELAALADLLHNELLASLAADAEPKPASTPPFSTIHSEWARWLLIVQNEANRFGHVRASGSAAREANNVTLLQRLGSLIPQVREEALRQLLTELRLFVESTA